MVLYWASSKHSQARKKGTIGVVFKENNNNNCELSELWIGLFVGTTAGASDILTRTHWKLFYLSKQAKRRLR
ncbi:hypothetical protein GUJ93_ZPchr0004g39749 [Zizania palustris]|uniref:Uncharacterized protein n=1 Tax=Zizania palustris TaxID=103762 RepID=A0A8J5SA56_ZIZPA|nr:hypothetical protein GUJ93_ZPchr0004g39749 [Zizania palustris]